jgi:hypothetical protein
MKTILHRGYDLWGIVPIHSIRIHVCWIFGDLHQGLSKRRWQHKRATFIMVLLEYKVFSLWMYRFKNLS